MDGRLAGMNEENAAVTGSGGGDENTTATRKQR
jgi:hypothetical protein